MIHLSIKKNISEYFDNELSARRQKKMFKHIDKCSSCGKHFEEQKKIVGRIEKSLFAEICDMKAPEYLWERTYAEIKKQSTAGVKQSIIPKFAFFIIMLFAIILASIIYYKKVSILRDEFVIPAFFDAIAFLSEAVKSFYYALLSGIIGIYKTAINFVLTNQNFIMGKLWIIGFVYFVFSLFGAVLVAGSFGFNHYRWARVIKK